MLGENSASKAKLGPFDVFLYCDDNGIKYFFNIYQVHGVDGIFPSTENI